MGSQRQTNFTSDDPIYGDTDSWVLQSFNFFLILAPRN